MAYTSLLGLLLPTTGTLSGTWGTAVNNQISPARTTGTLFAAVTATVLALYATRAAAAMAVVRVAALTLPVDIATRN